MEKFACVGKQDPYQIEQTKMEIGSKVVPCSYIRTLSELFDI